VGVNGAQGVNAGFGGGSGGSGGSGGDACGGGLYLAGGSATLTNDTLSGNSAQGGGGGGGGGGFGHASGGSGGSGGNASGGALCVAGGAATLTNDTLSGNSAQGGGGGRGGNGGNGANGGSGGNASGGALCVAGGAATLTNSTLSGNSAQGSGGGGGGGGYIAGNGGNGGSASGGGLSIVSGSTITLTNTLIAQDTLTAGTPGAAGIGRGTSGTGSAGSASGPDVSGSVTSSDHDLVGDGTGSNLSDGVNGDQVGASASPINPLLGPLQDNGGPAPTMALLPGSPALDAGDGTVPGLPTTDQRGFARLSGAAVDIGAFEVQDPLFDTTALANGTYGTPYSQTVTATATGGAAGPFTFAVTAGALPPGLSQASDGTLSGTPTAAGSFSFTVTATDSDSDTGSQSYTLTIDKADLYVTATANSKTYGQTASDTGTLSGLVNGDSITASFASAGDAASAAAGSYTITATLADPNNQQANYTVHETDATLTVSPAALTVTAVNFSATAGAPYSGTVATFTTAYQVDGAAAYTAVITWGDGSTSTGVVSGSNGSFTVCGSHTYAAASSYALSVQITNPDTQSATVNDTATVTGLGQGVVKGLTAGIGFWHSKNGQALIDCFNGGPSSTALGNWLAASFPNLYGAGTGANSLAGKTNAQVAAYFQTLFALGGKQVQAQVLATSLNVYATTSSLGGTAGAAYGFSVSATGLGARSYSVGKDGAAFGVANNTTLNVYQLVQAVNNKAVNGVLYGGNATWQAQCANLFNSLDQAGSIG
jgi:hypothetical protein